MGMVDGGLNVTSNTKCRTILITEHMYMCANLGGEYTGQFRPQTT